MPTSPTSGDEFVLPMENRAQIPYPKYPLEKLARVFTSSLLQPGTPCSKLFLGSLVAMTHPDGAIDDIRCRIPEILCALLHLLTQNKDPHEILIDFVDGWDHDHCACHQDSDPLVVEVRDFAERLAGSDISFIPFLFIYFIASPLAVALLPLETQHSLRTTRSAWNKLGGEIWPRSLGELSPHGIDRTIDRLLAWPQGLIISGEHHSPIDLSTIVSKPLLLLAIIDEVNPLLSGTIRHIRFPRTITLMVQLLLAQQTVTPPTRGGIHRALANCTDLIRTIRLFSCARSSDLQAFVERASAVNLLDKFLTAMSDLLGAVSQWTRILGFRGDLEATESPCREILRGFALATAAILRQIGRAPDPVRYHPIIVRICDSIFSRTNGNPFYLVTYPLGRLYREDVCCRRGCSESGVTQSQPLSRCSKCAVARYCSKLCQRAAWKDGESPHKAACKDLAEFQKFLDSHGPGLGAWLEFDGVQATEVQNKLAWRVFDHLAYALDDAAIHTNSSNQSSSTPEDSSTQQNSGI